MAGNVATIEGFSDLESWGADSIRVGVGGGSICSTRIRTGHGIPTLQSVMNCASVARNAKIIADGGLKTSGDIVKALAAGADGLDLVDDILRQAPIHLTENGWLFVEVGNSEVHMFSRYPELPIQWVEFENGGHGVFAISKNDLVEYWRSVDH